MLQWNTELLASCFLKILLFIINVYCMEITTSLFQTNLTDSGKVGFNFVPLTKVNEYSACMCDT